MPPDAALRWYRAAEGEFRATPVKRPQRKDGYTRGHTHVEPCVVCVLDPSATGFR